MVLHFYQPPTQEPAITRNILIFCYLPLLRMLVQKSGYGLTLNLSGCLLAQLEKMGASEFFVLIKQLVAEGKIEIVNSAMYHPLMPVTAKGSVSRQIEQNAKILARLLGSETQAGFFPPELAVDEPAMRLIPNQYVVVDESAVKGKRVLGRYGEKYLVTNNRRIGELLRSYPSQLGIKSVLAQIKDSLTVTANDAELFGHHYVERLQVLSDLLEQKEIKMVTVSQAIARFGDEVKKVTKILPSTWQNTKGFDLWTRNRLQERYLKLLKIVEALPHDNRLYDRATSSCYLYWLSNWPWWHPGLVEKGAQSLIQSVKNDRAQRIYQDFLTTMWRYHDSGKVDLNYKKFDQVKALLTH